jgi:hypothetical protein
LTDSKEVRPAGLGNGLGVNGKEKGTGNPLCF